MSRKVSTSVGSIVNPKRTVTWNKGKRTVTNTKVVIDKNGEVFERTTSRGFNFGGLLKIVFIVLIVASLFSIFIGSSEKSFYSFLLMLRDVPDYIKVDGVIDFFKLVQYNIDLPNWLDFIEPLLQILLSLCTLVMFVCKGILAALTYIFYFMKWLFL